MNDPKKVSGGVNVFEKAVEAAQKAGACYAKAIAEYIRDELSVVNTMTGPTVMVWNGAEREPLEAAMARLRQSENVGALFTDGKLNVRTMGHDVFRAVRKHSPELLGLRRERQ